MAHDGIEIEVKFPLLNPKETLGWLGKNAEFKYERRQIDEYFNAPHRDFFAGERVDDWLRLRSEDGGKHSINYKHWHQSETESFYCDESESEISSADDMRRILASLQFAPVIKVDKLRRAFRLGNAEIAVDEVDGLGFFIEVEHYGDGADKEKIKRDLIASIKKMGAKTGPEDHRGYPYHLLKQKGFIKT
jgi:adenylate cyclase class 2